MKVKSECRKRQHLNMSAACEISQNIPILNRVSSNLEQFSKVIKLAENGFGKFQIKSDQ